MKVLAIITARGGSKGIPKKNIIDLNGKPLIQYTIDATKSSELVDRIFLSSDDKEIIEVSKSLGVSSDYIRPEHLANDTASSSDAVIDALEWLEKNENYIPDAVMLLQPTSPLRSSDDISFSIKQFINDKKNCLVSVHEMLEHPFECVSNIDSDNWNFLAEQDIQATRRQDYNDEFYYINGAIYLVDYSYFKENRKFLDKTSTSFFKMPHVRGIDIDEYIDLRKAEFFLQGAY